MTLRRELIPAGGRLNGIEGLQDEGIANLTAVKLFLKFI